jgi:hypothetical protein
MANKTGGFAAIGVSAGTGVGIGSGVGGAVAGFAVAGRLDLPLLVLWAETLLATKSKRRVVKRVVTFFMEIVFERREK